MSLENLYVKVINPTESYEKVRSLALDFFSGDYSEPLKIILNDGGTIVCFLKHNERVGFVYSKPSNLSNLSRMYCVWVGLNAEGTLSQSVPGQRDLSKLSEGGLTELILGLNEQGHLDP